MFAFVFNNESKQSKRKFQKVVDEAQNGAKINA